ncbi:hypothetical protein [Paraferrimonas haliotis]|uniref:hypothetical protein n=1 Tax=Paraferrimonas haliotis TaxID=2013866 RepID=UPI000BA9860E|nr:hypothetical protein [Paraferrimonas haliotis]
MGCHAVNRYSLPFHQTTEHMLPGSIARISGKGLLFSSWARSVQLSQRLWIVMRDCESPQRQVAGDRVALAKVISIDWLSQDSITLTLDVYGWGEALHNVDGASQTLLAEQQALWCDQEPCNDCLFISAFLRQWLEQELCKRLGTKLDYRDWRNPNWVCLRWLELLPLSVETKQNLLKVGDCEIAVRYLTILLEQIDPTEKSLRLLRRI